MGVQFVAPPLVYAAELQEIEERGSLVVAVQDNQPPLAFQDAAGQWRGLEIDIAQRLASELSDTPLTLTIQSVRSSERLPAVTEGEVDLAIARLTYTESRARLVDFSLPYYVDGTALITRDPSIQRFSDLTTQSIAVLNGSSTIAVIRYFLPAASLIGVDSYAEGRSHLDDHQATAFAADGSILAGWVQENPEYHLIPGLLSAEALCIAMPRGLQYDSLRRQVNGAIARWREEGWLQERIDYWGLPQ